MNVSTCHCALASCTEPVALIRTAAGNTVVVCQVCLDSWFDQADDEPIIEPTAWWWIAEERTAA
ncbi:hypothetical protein [Streptomyces sp. NPDC006784]|uniref:hypothetical protein n=1 Tax=Streptomyces sp. NPDC006784 TaxID=3364764 RepID=UPI0036AC3037